MFYNVKDIRNIRKKLGITQTQLANQSGVSQSLIAKIESNRIDPAYSNVQKIFNALNHLSKIKDITAKDIMAKNIFSCKPTDSIRDVIKRMKKKEISQLPVISQGQVAGLVTERNIVNKLLESDNISMISQVMEEPPPLISRNTRKDALIEMLKFFPLLIVQKDGKLSGVITKSDLIRKMFN